MARPRTGKSKICEECGTEFYIRPSRHNNRKYCSRKCSDKHLNDSRRGVINPTADCNTDKICINCGVIFRNKTTSVKYCSHKCYSESNKGIRRTTDTEKQMLKKIRDKTNYHIRRARLKGLLTEKFNPFEIFERDGWKCHLCGYKINRKLKHPHPKSVSIDHIIPISMGGGHVRSNVKAAHLHCNCSKRTSSKQEQLLLIG